VCAIISASSECLTVCSALTYVDRTAPLPEVDVAATIFSSFIALGPLLGKLQLVYHYFLKWRVYVISTLKVSVATVSRHSDQRLCSLDELKPCS